MRSLLLYCLFVLQACAGTQPTQTAAKDHAAIQLSEVERIERTLASDEMQGRRAGTPGIEKAAAFIAAEFKKAGLQPVQGNSYLQEFTIVQPKLLSVKGEMDGVEINPKNIVVISSQANLSINEKSGYKFQTLSAANIRDPAQFGSVARTLIRSKENTVIFVDSSFATIFPRLSSFKRQMFKKDNNAVFILGAYHPKQFSIKQEQSIEETKLANVVGMLPGNSKKNEYVIFSAHYDHLGIGRPVNGDSIYNGANDDAAGTTAVIMLANYFKKQGGNERTLVFAAFTAEEMGGFGSQYFSQQYDPDQVIAMFNIEMIGTESKWGRNAAYITGYDRTDMGKILQRNLEGSSFTFHPDPYPEQQLFYRSDNATLARLGVPAHTISTAKMDAEKYYHTVDDEVETLDMQNMAQIIQAIAVSSKSIISGRDTPSRVPTETLQ
ncbi:MAG: M20/M25/M40 family metallo-hydrolase [Flavisolibacter sp.]|nr:M20/M25/M40 family metallo-hydrolase [Flavisolibacter sp.]